MPIRHSIQSALIEFIAALVIAALIVVIPSPLVAQQKAAVASTRAARFAAAVEDEESASTPGKPGNEGIKVHGHWIIDVKDKDGKLVEHRDFQNALTTDGASLLIRLIGGLSVPNSMAVVTHDITNNLYFYMFPPVTSTTISPYSSQSICKVGSYNTAACNPNLMTTLAGSNNTGYTSITLASQFTASAAGSINYVQTTLATCQQADGTTATYSPTQCGVSTNYSTSAPIPIYSTPLTGTTLSPYLNVAAGQTVSVTVVLSFS